MRACMSVHEQTRKKANARPDWLRADGVAALGNGAPGSRHEIDAVFTLARMTFIGRERSHKPGAWDVDARHTRYD